MSKALEIAKALVDFVVSQTLHAFSAELLNVERRHDRTENHRPSQRRLIQLFLTGKISHQASGKSITCARWIENRLERVGRDREVFCGREHSRAVFTSFHD